ncbi:MAG TPA: hypothetical protein VMZ00_06760 [Sporichthya sp.]|nr:hypothetical protein [Sporichthya sp.]
MKKSWTPMRLERVGSAADILLGGGGKLSPIPGDPGDVRKPKGSGA